MIFEFYWSWYEEYQPHILEGEKKTQEEFEVDCKKALKESFDGFISNVGDSWAGLLDWIRYAVLKMEDYGYKIVEPMKFGYFGLYLPKTDRYCKENDKIRDKEHQEQFPEFLDEIKRMIAHNDIVDERLYKDLYDKIDKEEKST